MTLVMEGVPLAMLVMNSDNEVRLFSLLDIRDLLDRLDDEGVGPLTILVKDLEVVAEIAESVAVETHRLTDDRADVQLPDLGVPLDNVVERGGHLCEHDHIVVFEQGDAQVACSNFHFHVVVELLEFADHALSSGD